MNPLEMYGSAGTVARLERQVATLEVQVTELEARSSGDFHPAVAAEVVKLIDDLDKRKVLSFEGLGIKVTFPR